MVSYKSTPMVFNDSTPQKPGNPFSDFRVSIFLSVHFFDNSAIWFKQQIHRFLLSSGHQGTNPASG